MATIIDVEQLDTPLASLIARMEQGEDIVIARGAVEVAKLVPVPIASAKKPDRVPGLLKGKISLPDSFFDPLPEEELRAWEGR